MKVQPGTSDPASQMLCERVIALRRENGFTLEQLAAASGVSRSMLSQIERGQANPTLAVTFRIAQAFALTIGELVDDPGAGSNIEVIHHSDPNAVFRSDEQCQVRTLSPLHMEKNTEFYELHIRAAGALESRAHFDGTRELLTIAKGQAKLTSGDTQCALGPGDSARYRADLPHQIANVGKRELVAYLVVTYK